MNYTELETFVIKMLQNELSADLTYHHSEHTLDVLNAVVEIGIAESVSEKELCLLKTAALLHDSGFIKGYQHHEMSSCSIAKEILPDYNYSSEDIENICQLILATQVPQRPKNHLEMIICDADLDYLGRNDFDKISETLFTEFLAYHIVRDRNGWNKVQRSFLESHTFWTETTKNKRNKLKSDHLNHIRSMIAE